MEIVCDRWQGQRSIFDIVKLFRAHKQILFNVFVANSDMNHPALLQWVCFVLSPQLLRHRARSKLMQPSMGNLK